MEPTRDPHQQKKSAVESTETPGSESTVVLWFSRLFVVVIVGVIAFLLGNYQKTTEKTVREYDTQPLPVQTVQPPPPIPVALDLPTTGQKDPTLSTAATAPTPAHQHRAFPLPAADPEPTDDQAPAEPRDKTLSLPDLARLIHPSVVSIIGHDIKGTAQSSGTGFIVRGDGIIATNRHVVEEADSLTVQTSTGSFLAFEGVLQHAGTADVVLLKVAEKGLPPLDLEKTPSFEVGDSVAVVGSPLGLDGTLSAGIVSAIRMNDPTVSGISGATTHDAGYIQISAPISPGPSGSPVVDETGKVIAIATAKIKGGENLNLALPIRHVLYLLVVAGDKIPIPLHEAFPPTERPSTETSHAPPPPPVEENHGDLAAEIALLYLELGDSGQSFSQGENWYADPVDYFDEGLISRAQALEIEKKYEERWPVRIHRPLDVPHVNELETGKWGVAITSEFAISDGKRQFKRMIVTTGLVIDMATTRRVESVKTLKADSESLNRFQFQKLFNEIIDHRLNQR